MTPIDTRGAQPAVRRDRGSVGCRLSALQGRLRMFLGTPRKWWIAAAVPLVLGFVLLATGDGTVLRTAAAIVLLLLAMVLFGMAPMCYGQSAHASAADRGYVPDHPDR